MAMGQDFLGWLIVGDEMPIIFAERARRNRGANLGHHLQVKVGIVNAEHPQAENFICTQQVAEISPREMPAGKTSATFLNGAKIRFIGAAFERK